MNVEIIQGGRVLRRYNHEGRSYIEAPPSGDYEIRLTNNHSRRRLAVLSVDGVNAVDGSEAGYNGPGYVLRPWESITVKGWRRSESEVARFTFTPQDGSYAAQTGRGTRNTGVIGVAVFEEKEKSPLFIPPTIIREEHHHHHHDYGWPWVVPTILPQPRVIWGSNSDHVSYSTTGGDTLKSSTVDINCCTETGHVTPESSREVVTKVSESIDLGTGYGERATMYTATTEFERASESPSTVIVLYYEVREKLKARGIPVDERPTHAQQAFPASSGMSVAAPPGWRG